jgi:hypothetical protein
LRFKFQGGSVAIESRLKVKILRNPKVSTHPFPRYFKGFDKVEAVQRIFGERTEEVLSSLRVEFAGMRGYMGVSDVDGHLMVSAHYLKNGDIIDIYLDVIHELVHVRQFMEGKELFDNNYSYSERPTEVEAYRHVVAEARNLELDDERICKYLKTEWMSDEDLQKLAKTLNVKCDSVKEKRNDCKET